MTEVLFIHGILGKPDYFDFILPYLPADVQPTLILLEGHGGSPKEFGKSSMAHWRNQVIEKVEYLRKRGDKLAIVAHSMGCLFALEAALDGKADALFLLNPPLSIRITRRILSTPIKILTGNINDRLTLAAKNAYSITDDRNLLHYMSWIPRYIELLREIKRIRGISGSLNVPTRIYLSEHDEMVSPRSANMFPRRGDIKITMLSNSGHYYYEGNDRATIIKDFNAFFREALKIS